MKLPAIRDNVPADPRAIPTVDNVLAEMMRAGEGDALAEVVLQLKTFTEIVWAASYGADIDIGFTLESVDVCTLGSQLQSPQRHHPELTISPRIQDFEAGRRLHRMLSQAMWQSERPVVMDFYSSFEVFHADGTGPSRFELKIPGSTEYGDRWRNLILLMFNATPEMKSKVDFLAAARVECKTELETAMLATCVALSAFYGYAMHSRKGDWYRDPFKPAQEAHQLAYEPRLGQF